MKKNNIKERIILKKRTIQREDQKKNKKIDNIYIIKKHK